MRQARDLLYRKVHLGSNPNPGASPACFSSGVSHQVFHSLVTGQPRFVRIKASLAPSSICFMAMPPVIATARLLITSPQPLGCIVFGIAIATAAPASTPAPAAGLSIWADVGLNSISIQAADGSRYTQIEGCC